MLPRPAISKSTITPHICPRFQCPYNAVTASVHQKHTASLFVLRLTVQLQLGGAAEGNETLKPVQK
jgi:hypothetical protein